jgi:transcriptional regulator with XRE-family HTH domain
MNRDSKSHAGRSRNRAQSQSYFAALGARVAAIRKSQGFTQAELAQRIDVSQQAIFAYELGERRISVLILEKLADVFCMSLEELARTSRPIRSKRQRVSPRAMRNAERLQALTKTQQRFIVKIIDNFEGGNGNGNVSRHHRSALPR